MWAQLTFLATVYAAHRDARVNHIPQNDVDELRHLGSRVHHVPPSRPKHYNTTTSSELVWSTVSRETSLTSEIFTATDRHEVTVTTFINHVPTVIVYDADASIHEGSSTENDESLHENEFEPKGETDEPQFFRGARY